jgi:hypothetical protein
VADRKVWLSLATKGSGTMNTYLFTATVVTRRTVEKNSPYGPELVVEQREKCPSLIVAGTDAEHAQKYFEDRVREGEQSESPAEVDITRLIAAQFVEQLFTESGGVPLDWPTITAEITASIYETPADDFEQGFWVDVNAVVRPGRLAPDIEALKLSVAEDVRTGVNWSPGRMFYYVVNVLSRELPSCYRNAESSPEADQDAGPVANLPAMEPTVEIAHLWERETVALVKARNSIVAGWLWRQFAAETTLAQNPIYIDPSSPGILLGGAQDCQLPPDGNLQS